MAELTTFKCRSPGLVGFEVFIEKTNDGYEARQAVALFGSFQMKEGDLEKINYNPFHKDFYDNYVIGEGSSEEEAIEELKVDYKELYESLWR